MQTTLDEVKAKMEPGATAPNTSSATPEAVKQHALQEEAAKLLVPTEKSWGDRFKKRVYNAGTYIGLNYFVNTLVSVALAYKFELKYKDGLQQKSHQLGDVIAEKFGGNAKKLGNGIFMGAKGFTLTLGGTGLVPVIKSEEDHKRGIEYKIGHALDVLQEKLGRGNTASAQNIADFHKVEADKKNPGSIEFTAEEKSRLWSKHCLEFTDESKKPEFREHKLPWLKVIVARIAAWASAFGTNFGLGYVGIGEKLKGASSSGTTAIAKAIPSYKLLEKPDLFTEYLLNDAILTVSSSVTHKFVQGKLHKDLPDMAPIEKDEVRPLEGRPTREQQMEKRRKLIAEGNRDHRNRAEAAIPEPVRSL